MRAAWICGIAWLVVASGVWAQDPQVTSRKIDDSTYVLFGGRGLGANVGLSVGEDGLLLVDSMNARSSEKLLAAIREISDRPIRYVLNTHAHADHAGGNDFFAQRGAVIISHENSRYAGVRSDVTVTDELSLRFNGEEIRTRHVKAHTYGDLLIHFSGSDVLFLGDTFTNTWHPTATGFGLASELEATELALGMAGEGTVVVPGHGVLDERSGLERSRRLAEAWFGRVAALVRERADLEAMVADPELNRLRAAFVEKSDRFETIPESMFERFIQRTLSSDFVVPYPMREADLRRYAGHYRTSAEDTLEVTVRAGGLTVDQPSGFIEQIVPLSPGEFHIRSSLGGRYEFSLGRDGSPVGLLRIAGDERLEARRVTGER